MRRALDQTAPAPPEFRLGKEISVEEMMPPTLAVSPNGEVAVYLGCLNKLERSGNAVACMTLAARDRIPRESRRFVRVQSGGVFASEFLSDSGHFKILQDRFVFWPRSSNSCYGVLHSDSRKEDEELTRQVFGITQTELEEILRAYYGATHNPIGEHEFRVHKTFATTFSKTRDNRCDLTHEFIPQEFPFIRLGESSFFGGHVSLSAFYRLIALQCQFPMNRPGLENESLFSLLVKNGAKVETLKRVCKAASGGPDAPLLYGLFSEDFVCVR